MDQHERSEIILSRFSEAERGAVLQDPSSAAALHALAAYSPGLTQSLAVRVDLARWLFLDKAFEKPAHPENFGSELAAQPDEAEGLADLQAALRRFRLKEIARLAVRDLSGRADLGEVMETLSRLADACLNRALEKAMFMSAQRYGVSVRGLGFDPVIMGMGKLGGGELNYSSDVDLIYLYVPTQPAPGAPPPQQSAQAVFTTVTRAMSDVTEDGLVFRVDLDLRPGGKDGAQAQSLDAALRHYLSLGQAWERMALLKARPAAGNLEAGRRFTSELEPFIFRGHLDYTSLEELGNLKNRFSREKKARHLRLAGPGRSEPPINVKLSPGGIREVEFFTQALTLTFGGRLRHLRCSRTLDGLAALSEEGLISRDDRESLARAYVFLRTVEHRLQLRELSQTQMLPRDQSARASLARSMGFTENPWLDFRSTLDVHMAQVKQRFGQLLSAPAEKEGPAGTEAAPPDWVTALLAVLDEEEQSLEVLSEAGFQRPESARRVCLDIRDQKFLPGPLARYGDNLERLLPDFIAAAAEAIDPDRAILHLERFLTSVGPRAGFFILLEENPDLIRLLCLLFGSGDYLSEILISHPAILDSLIDRRSALDYKTRDELAADIEVMLGPEEDPEAALTVIRRFRNDEILRVGLYDLLGALSLDRIQMQLSNLAEVVMARTLRLAAEMITGRTPDADRPLPLAVICLGKLGGRELSYGSDLDLIFILGRLRGAPQMDMNTAVRIAQRFISFLSVRLDAGPGYEIDSRLRPSGRQGPLVVTKDSFIKYHQTSQLWERQALLKARGVLGPAGLLKAMRTEINRAVWGRDLGPDPADEIHRLKLRMKRERGRVKSDRINLKFSPGGMVDLEFAAQYVQLQEGGRLKGNIRSPRTTTVWRAMQAKGVGAENPGGAAEAYELLARVSGRLGLIYNRTGDRAAFTAQEIDRAEIPGLEGSTLQHVRRALETGAEAYRRVFGREADHAGS